METKTSAKDFFLHLGAMVALYVSVASFLNLLFSVIDKAYPEIQNYYYGYSSMYPQISLPVATLIIVFPIFILLSWINHRSYEMAPEKKQLAIRKWLTYITLFVAGGVLAGDLVTILYKFLDGQNLTGAFILKALAVLVVAGLVFGFYLQDIRDRISKNAEKVWALITIVIIILAIIAGFSVIGSPRTQRLLKYDEQKVMDLQNTQYQITNYWQTSGALPDTLPNAGLDVQTGKPYEYRKTGDMSFELCAEFNKENNLQNSTTRPTMLYKSPNQNDNWDHKSGRACFARTVDAVTYPIYVPR